METQYSFQLEIQLNKSTVCMNVLRQFYPGLPSSLYCWRNINFKLSSTSRACGSVRHLKNLKSKFEKKGPLV